MMNASTDHHAGFTGARESRLSVARFALTGALVALLVFALCWVATFLPDVRVTHMYIQLFTAARMSSGADRMGGRPAQRSSLLAAPVDAMNPPSG
jgi:hypothetical protein